MKNYFYRPPAFKSDVENKAPSDGQENDLYLKGQDYHSGEKVDFDETYELGGTNGGRAKKEHRWQLTVFKSGNAQLGEIGGGASSLGGYGEDEMTCNNGKLEITTPTDQGLGKWEKAVAKS